MQDNKNMNWIWSVILLTALLLWFLFAPTQPDRESQQQNQEQSKTPISPPNNQVSPPLQQLDEFDQPTFNGYACTQDCSGHEAGYNWAEEQGIEDPDDCSGNSNSFIEGCRSYAEEQLQEIENALEYEY